ncbi:MAG: hypothetical protein ACLQUY_04495 [Ktedonobacterales bacterium]
MIWQVYPVGSAEWNRTIDTWQIWPALVPLRYDAMKDMAELQQRVQLPLEPADRDMMQILLQSGFPHNVGLKLIDPCGQRCR